MDAVTTTARRWGKAGLTHVPIDSHTSSTCRWTPPAPLAHGIRWPPRNWWRWTWTWPTTCPFFSLAYCAFDDPTSCSAASISLAIEAWQAPSEKATINVHLIKRFSHTHTHTQTHSHIFQVLSLQFVVLFAINKLVFTPIYMHGVGVAEAEVGSWESPTQRREKRGRQWSLLSVRDTWVWLFACLHKVCPEELQKQLQQLAAELPNGQIPCAQLSELLSRLSLHPFIYIPHSPQVQGTHMPAACFNH